jgi:RNA polymerase sigma-70 factor, ECF subfamily
MAASAVAIEELYRARYEAFHRTLSSVTGSFESGHDAVQEAFARALRQRKQYRGEARLETWVWRIALRTAADMVRVSAPTAPSEIPERAIAQPGRDPELAAALQRLSPRRRLMIFLHYFADLSQPDIAAALQVTEGTVASTLARARVQLSEFLTYEGAKR